ncbi:MAG: hypothetical protein PHS96_07295 [Anaerolineales bacterium]|nr:hypothetical protein [Anaerolineales bacterium]
MRNQAIQRAAFLASLAALAAAVGFGALAWARSGEATVEVEWQTASELNTLGFNLYRGEEPDGPFEKVNPSLITASNDAILGGEYSYTDRLDRPGARVYYQLEEVEIGGATTRHGPIEGVAQSANRHLLLLAAGLAVLGGLGLALTWPPATLRRESQVPKTHER